MSSGGISVARSATKKKSRRRNKRRTADSSESESSSPSDVEDIPVKLQEVVSKEVTKKYADIELSDAELSDLEVEDITMNDAVEDLTASTNILKDKQKIEDALKLNSNELKKDYLSLIFQNYGDDIDKLREAPDFTAKSLSLLANVLKDGSSMFDEDTLKTIFENK